MSEKVRSGHRSDEIQNFPQADDCTLHPRERHNWTPTSKPAKEILIDRMPIQNVGTLLENLVLTETVSVLGGQLAEGECLAVATAFAMPALSAWAPHKLATGISTDALERIAGNTDSADFLRVMRRCLSYRLDGGPNGALLAGLLSTLKGWRLRVWANDIREGHYGDAIPTLEALPALVSEILPPFQPQVEVDVCDQPYPESIQNLNETLKRWKGVGALVGFLDPMRYAIDSHGAACTRSGDHLQWLDTLKTHKQFASVHFTGNSDSRSLADELNGLRQDLQDAQVFSWREFKRQHYVVSVGCSSPQLLKQIEKQVLSSWNAWCSYVPEIRDRRLTVVGQQ